MTHRVLAEWSCDGCESQVLREQAQGLPPGWVVLQVVAGVPNQATLVLCRKCTSAERRGRVLEALLDPVFSAAAKSGVSP